jgi:hypothetical protein
VSFSRDLIPEEGVWFPNLLVSWKADVALVPRRGKLEAIPL